jgi:dCMP deaminase
MPRNEYYMTIAMAVRKKANCLGRRVGGPPLNLPR